MTFAAMKLTISDACLIASSVGSEQFERDVTSELRIFSAINSAHAALTNFIDDAVVQQQAFRLNRTHLDLRMIR